MNEFISFPILMPTLNINRQSTYILTFDGTNPGGINLNIPSNKPVAKNDNMIKLPFICDSSYYLAEIFKISFREVV
mgnify:CR=1 FL=1